MNVCSHTHIDRARHDPGAAALQAGAALAMRQTAVRLQPACLVAILLACAPLATDSKRARRKARPSASGESRGSGVGARRPAAAAPPQPPQPWESPSAATEAQLEECLGGLRSGVPPPLQPAALVERWRVTKMGNDELRVGSPSWRLLSALLDGDAAGVHVDVDAPSPGPSGFRLVHFVTLAKSASLLRLLRLRGADTLAPSTNGMNALHMALMTGGEMNVLPRAWLRLATKHAPQGGGTEAAWNASLEFSRAQGHFLNLDEGMDLAPSLRGLFAAPAAEAGSAGFALPVEDLRRGLKDWCAEMLRLLLDGAAAADAKRAALAADRTFKQTPLHYAAMEGNAAAMLRLLEAAGSDALEGLLSTDLLKRTPLHLAALRGETATVALIRDKITEGKGAAAYDQLFEAAKDISGVTPAGHLAFHEASVKPKRPRRRRGSAPASERSPEKRASAGPGDVAPVSDSWVEDGERPLLAALGEGRRSRDCEIDTVQLRDLSAVRFRHCPASSS